MTNRLHVIAVLLSTCFSNCAIEQEAGSSTLDSAWLATAIPLPDAEMIGELEKIIGDLESKLRAEPDDRVLHTMRVIAYCHLLASHGKKGESPEDITARTKAVVSEAAKANVLGNSIVQSALSQVDRTFIRLDRPYHEDRVFWLRMCAESAKEEPALYANSLDQLQHVYYIQGKVKEQEDTLWILIATDLSFRSNFFELGKILFEQQRFDEIEELFSVGAKSGERRRETAAKKYDGKVLLVQAPKGGAAEIDAFFNGQLSGEDIPVQDVARIEKLKKNGCVDLTEEATAKEVEFAEDWIRDIGELHKRFRDAVKSAKCKENGNSTM